MSTLSILLKRATRTKLSRDDLFSYAGNVIANPPQVGGFAKSLAEGRTRQEQSHLDNWRRDIKNRLNTIADEGSWKLQKLQNLKQQLHYARYLGIYDAISAGNEDSLVWHEWFEEDSWFLDVPKDSWLSHLEMLRNYALLNRGILTAVGIACYGNKKTTANLVQAYQEWEKETHRHNIRFNEALFEIRRQFPRMNEIIDTKYSKEIASDMRELNSLIRGFAEQICTEKVNQEEIGDRWASLASKQNSLVIQIGEEASAQVGA